MARELSGVAPIAPVPVHRARPGMKEVTAARTQAVLTKAQLDALRKKLQDERRRVLSVLNQPLSSMPAGEPQEVEEAAQRASERDEALGKMDAGTYGVSEKTGDPIPYERLLALPWARHGVDE